MSVTRLMACTSLLALLSFPAAAQMSANPPEIGQKIREMGRELTREVVEGTMRLYAPLHAAAPKDGVKVTTDVSYGPAERNVLDIYVPEASGSDRPPLLVFVHGGGFVRGDKKEVANIGYYFARHGVATLTINYRLAPTSTWPSGPEDLAAVLRWIRQNPDAHGGDPDRVFLAGNSAGAMHVAGYVFFEEQQVPNDGVRGAVLISCPSVNLAGRDLDPQRDALYYGTDPSRYTELSVVNNLDGRKVPLFLSVGEYDLPLVHDQNRQLIDALYARDGSLPNVKTALGHNHVSIVEHFGTADETLGPDMLEFIAAQSR